MEKFKNFIKKIYIYLINTFLSFSQAFFCSCLVVDITEQNQLNFKKIPNTKSFKLCILCFGLMIGSYILDYKSKNKLSNIKMDAAIKAGVFDSEMKELVTALSLNNKARFTNIIEMGKELDEYISK